MAEWVALILALWHNAEAGQVGDHSAPLIPKRWYWHTDRPTQLCRQKLLLRPSRPFLLRHSRQAWPSVQPRMAPWTLPFELRRKWTFAWSGSVLVQTSRNRRKWNYVEIGPFLEARCTRRVGRH